MKHLSNIIKFATVAVLFCASLLLLFAESDSLFTLLITKSAGVALVALATALFNRWESSMPRFIDPDL